MTQPAVAKDRTALGQAPAVRYVAPFVVFIAALAIERLLPLSPAVLYPLRFVLVLTVILAVSRKVVVLRPSRPFASTLLGIAVFAVWVGPDVLWPGYRQSVLFQNAMTGTVSSSLPDGLRADPFFLLVRVLGSVALVPVLEEPVLARLAAPVADQEGFRVDTAGDVFELRLLVRCPPVRLGTRTFLGRGTAGGYRLQLVDRPNR